LGEKVVLRISILKRKMGLMAWARGRQKQMYLKRFQAQGMILVLADAAVRRFFSTLA